VAKDKEEKLAIIRGVQCGVGDYGKFALWFSTYISENTTALQVIEGGKAVAEFVEECDVRNIQDLDGKPVWVEVDGGLIKLLRPCVFK